MSEDVLAARDEYDGRRPFFRSDEFQAMDIDMDTLLSGFQEAVAEWHGDAPSWGSYFTLDE